MLRSWIATVAAAIVLFVWGGVTQMFPWGPPSAHAVTTESVPAQTGFHLRPPIVAEPGSLATAAFDEAFAGRIGMLFTDSTVSWISSMPLEYYDGAAYLTRQAATQGVVGAFLVALLLLLPPLGPRRSLAIIALGATAASVATYGVLANWWGLAPSYAVGESIDLIIGWTMAAVTASWVLRRGLRSARTELAHGS